MTTYSYSSESATDVRVGLLIVPVFEGPKPGPGVRESGLARAYSDAKHTGKRGESVLVTRRDRDRFTAGAVLLVGVGSKAEFTVEAARRALARAASTARRFGAVATTFPQAFAPGTAADAVRPRPKDSDSATTASTAIGTKPEKRAGISKVVVLGGPKWTAKPMKDAVKRAAVIVDAVVLGARPREHAGRRHAARRDRA